MEEKSESKQTTPWREYFPYTPRLNQDKIADFVYKNLNSGKVCIVEAPYGIGKTITMLSSALATKKKVLFGSCNHAAQNSIVDEVLTLNIHKKNLKIAALVGKKHFCPQLKDFYYEACDFARKEKECSYFENCYSYDDGRRKSSRMRKVLDFVNREVTESPEKLKGKSFVKFVREVAEREGVCPYEAMVSLAEEADVIVLDYFYLFSNIFTFTKNRILKEPDKYVLLIDEADEIKERLLSGILTRQTSSFSLHTLKEQIKKMMKSGKIFQEEFQALNDFSSIFYDFFRDKKEGYFDINKEVFIKSIDKTETKFDEMVQLISGLVEKAVEENESSTRLDKFLKFWEKFDDRFFSYGYKEGLSTKLCIAPYELKDVEIFKEGNDNYKFFDALKLFHSCVLFSATIGDIDIFRDTLGIEGEFLSSTEFTTKNFIAIIKKDISSIYSKRGEMAENVHQDIVLLKKYTPGILMSFPSMASSHEIVNRLDAKPIEDINPLLGGVYYVILGGKNSRGINKAAHLKTVYIYGLQLPQPEDYFFNKRKEQLTKKYGEEKAYRMLYSNVVNKACQTAGRIFRSKDKKGVIVFADSRYKYDYRLKDFFYKSISPYFRDKIVETMTQSEFETELAEFWMKE